MRTIHRDIVAAVIVSKDNKILLGKKDAAGGGVYADCWHIPGGGIEEGEDQLQALRRELLEEVGIDMRSATVSLIDDQGAAETQKTLSTGEIVLCKMKFNVYQVAVDKNAANIHTSLNDDLVQIAWAQPAKLSDFALTPPSVTLFTRLGYL